MTNIEDDTEKTNRDTYVIGDIWVNPMGESCKVIGFEIGDYPVFQNEDGTIYLKNALITLGSWTKKPPAKKTEKFHDITYTVGDIWEPLEQIYKENNWGEVIGFTNNNCPVIRDKSGLVGSLTNETWVRRVKKQKLFIYKSSFDGGFVTFTEKLDGLEDKFITEIEVEV